MDSSKATPFQLFLMAGFGIFAVIGLLFFSGVLGGSSSAKDIGPIHVWGTLDERAMTTVIRTLAENDDTLRQVTYEQKDARTYDYDLANALASGAGPDLFMLTQDQVFSQQAKIVTVPFDSLPEQTFQSMFIDESQLFLTPTGVLAIPLVVDPLVLYWNKDMLAAQGYAAAPKYWEEVFKMAEKLTVRDDAGTVQKSTIAFGSFDNVRHAKEILSALVMQAGGEITGRDAQGRVVSQLSAKTAAAVQPGDSAVRFFTTFADPSKNIYSWNRSMPDSLLAFTSGDLALYIGTASELPLIKAQNPNLNFAIAQLPQIQVAKRSVSFGRLYGLAIPKAARNPTAAFTIAKKLATAEATTQLATAWGLASSRRDVLAKPVDGADEIFRLDAIISRGFLDPDAAKTDQVFRAMINDVTSGSLKLSDAVQRADKEISNLLGL